MPQKKINKTEEYKSMRSVVAKALGEDTDSAVVLETLKDFRWHMTLYHCAIREVQTKFEVLDEELSISRVRNPIDHIESRVKTPESIIGKLRRGGYEFSVKSMTENLNDIAGIRVICQYVDDIYTVADMLSKQDDISVIKVKDYIKNPNRTVTAATIWSWKYPCSSPKENTMCAWKCSSARSPWTSGRASNTTSNTKRRSPTPKSSPKTSKSARTSPTPSTPECRL